MYRKKTCRLETLLNETLKLNVRYEKDYYYFFNPWYSVPIIIIIIIIIIIKYQYRLFGE